MILSWVLLSGGGTTALAQGTPEPKPYVRIMLGGDVMSQARVKESASRNGRPEQFGFGFLFEGLRSRVQSADIAFANLETPVSRTEVEKPRPFVFNAPHDMLRGLKWVGFDILSVINNHSLDQKLIGLSETLNAVQSEGLVGVGAGHTREDAISGHVSVVNGVKIGWLAYTAFINGGDRVARPSKSPYLNLLVRTPELHAAIAEMKTRADIVILSVHWGVEYKIKPEKWQRDLAAGWHERGVDVIVGHHPHVLQPAEWYKRKRDGKHCLTLYSLGNLVSNQAADFNPRRSPASEAHTRDSVLIELFLRNGQLAGFRPHPLWITNWKGIEEGIQTVVIDDVIDSLDRQIKEIKPSPLRTYLLEQKVLLSQRRAIIMRTLNLKERKAALLPTISIDPSRRRSVPGKTYSAQ